MTKNTGFNLYLIRHGESANNALPEHQRVADPNLTALGRKQALQLASYYSKFDCIDHILASPFRRTLQTAQPLLEARGDRAVIWADLYEVGGCYGGYETGKRIGQPGMTDTEIRNEFPEFDIPDSIDSNGWYKCQPFETWEMAIPRARAQAKKLRDSFGSKDNVVFCFIHAEFKQLLLEHLVPEQREYDAYEIANSSVTHINFSNDRGRVVDYCNTDHLQSSDLSY